MDRIVVKGARQHNLKNISLEIPRDKLTVITGVSGSGKSSLAFDTLYAEGQRRYVESLSSYARQFLERLEKPDVDSIEGLSPAIAIQPRTAARNPRSTVGTVTEIYDYLRVLFARFGQLFCHQCGRPIETQTIQQMVDRILALPEETRITLLAPITKDRKGEFRKELRDLRKAGFARVVVDGRVHDLEEEIALERNTRHEIDLVVDRIVVREGIQGRLADSLEVASRYGKETVKVVESERGEAWIFSQRAACVSCGISYGEITPRSLSFNNPQGACSGCAGIGSVSEVDPDRVIPDGRLSVLEGAIAPWSDCLDLFLPSLQALATHHKLDLRAPFEELEEGARRVILYGLGAGSIPSSGRRKRFEPFPGVIPWVSERLQGSEEEREELARYARERPCPECGGGRLKKESLGVRLGGKNISEITSLPLREARDFLSSVGLRARDEAIGAPVLKEILSRLSFLVEVGLDYLTLNRATWSLSGGESQRIRLATQIGSGLVGVLYILDEPSVGLHPRDNRRLLATLKFLRDLGNTVLVVEHDRDTILESDHVVDLGPGAGVLGGEVVAQGRPEEIQQSAASLTGRYLRGQIRVWEPRARRPSNGKRLSVRGARHNNLKGINVEIPLGVLVCVTGVSGSGKSSFAIDTLYRWLARKIHRAAEGYGELEGVDGWEAVDRVVNVDQSPIGRTPRSNPATYTGLFTHVRELFAKLPDSRVRGYGAARFSFNVKGGRCEGCLGAGMVRVEMHFLPDAFVTCELCKGRRFNRETLEAHYKGRSIADVLDLTVAEALDLFSAFPLFWRKLEVLRSIGLDYLRLGQPATTLSGGEAQRVKLGKELSRRAPGPTLYILDEPTTGLHFDDVRKLLDALNRLVDQGNTVMVIEHHLDVIQAADWIIDLGPEGGDRGGEVVAAGTPEEVALTAQSHTGRWLGRGDGAWVDRDCRVG